MRTTKEQREEMRAALRASLIADEGTRIILGALDDLDHAERMERALVRLTEFTIDNWASSLTMRNQVREIARAALEEKQP